MEQSLKLNYFCCCKYAIVALWLHRHSVGFKTSTILVYMILNGKGCLTGCGLHGYSRVPVLFNWSIQYRLLSSSSIIILLLNYYNINFFFYCICNGTISKTKLFLLL